MRNSLRPLFPDDAPAPEWSVDAAPAFRLGVVFAVFACAFLVILGRTVWIQVVISDRFLTGWDQPTETLESIPARDGRILSSDGQLLAYDAPRFDLLVHYRWLEEPANEAWLSATARTSLTRAERKNKALVAQARQKLLDQRSQLWEALAQVTRRSPEDLLAERRAIQARVERMRAAVEGRRKRTAEEAMATVTATRTGLAGLWDRVVHELTTPPERGRKDPLVIREELEFHPVVKGVPVEVVSTIEAFSSRFPGTRIEQGTDRIYPHGDLAAHLIGYRQEETVSSPVEDRSGSPNEGKLFHERGRVGRTGLERHYDATLKGQPGIRRITRNRKSELLSSVVVRAPVDGSDLTLTIDLRAQQTAEALLDRAIQARPSESMETPPRGGCLVAVDVRTGAVIAAATAPRFDLQKLVQGDRPAWNRWNDDPRQPFFPRATQMELPPGSLFKLITAVAGMQEGVLHPDETFECRGYLSEPDRERCAIFRSSGKGHGPVDLDAAICRSCNVYFLDAAQRIGGPALVDWADRFGLGRPTGIDVGGERTGTLPGVGPEDSADWTPAKARQLAIGQGRLTATPLQIARAVAAIANGGRLIPLHLRQENSGGTLPTPASGIQLVSQETASPLRSERIEGLLPGTLERIRRGMELTVSDSQGTGREAAPDRISIAGKTGTAEAGEGRGSHAWFAGYYPAEAPRVAIVVVLEEGGSGGRMAGPVAKLFIERSGSAGASGE